jgi:hypothetical protein
MHIFIYSAEVVGQRIDHVVSTFTSNLAKPNSSQRARNCDSGRPLVYKRSNPSPTATKRPMRFVRRFRPRWVALSWLLLIAVLVNARRPPPLPRSFRELSSEEISSLLKAKDPVTNLDPSDPNSHLSKILIPRPGECIRYLEPVTG